MTSPLVTIICATRNARAAVQLTFSSLERYTPEPKYVIVADNGSHDGTLRYLRSLDWVTVTSLECRRRGDPGASSEHGGTLDWLARQIKTPYFLALDSDVEFKASGWLSLMLELAEANGLAALGKFEAAVSGYRPRLAPALLLLRTSAFLVLRTSFRPFVRIMDPSEAARWQARPPRENLEVSELESYRTGAFYPTGAALFEQLEATGALWADLPDSMGSMFMHLAHMSWGATERGALRAQHRRQRAYIQEQLRRL